MTFSSGKAGWQSSYPLPARPLQQRSKGMHLMQPMTFLRSPELSEVWTLLQTEHQ